MIAIRKYRIFGIALFDLVLASVGMVIIFLFARSLHFPKLNPVVFIIAALLVTVPVGSVVHVLFGVNTQLNYDLGLSGKPVRT